MFTEIITVHSHDSKTDKRAAKINLKYQRFAVCSELNEAVITGIMNRYNQSLRLKIKRSDLVFYRFILMQNSIIQGRWSTFLSVRIIFVNVIAIVSV